MAKVNPLINEIMSKLKYLQLLDCLDFNWTNHLKSLVFVSNFLICKTTLEINLKCFLWNFKNHLTEFSTDWLDNVAGLFFLFFFVVLMSLWCLLVCTMRSSCMDLPVSSCLSLLTTKCVRFGGGHMMSCFITEIACNFHSSYFYCYKCTKKLGIFN